MRDSSMTGVEADEQRVAATPIPKGGLLHRQRSGQGAGCEQEFLIPGGRCLGFRVFQVGHSQCFMEMWIR